jgi:hypothetical protein
MDAEKPQRTRMFFQKTQGGQTTLFQSLSSVLRKRTNSNQCPKRRTMGNGQKLKEQTLLSGFFFK